MSSIREFAMAKVIAGGGGGGDVSVESLNVAANGSYTAPSGKAYNPVHVAVPEPSGTISIDSNGSYDVMQYASAAVDVPATSGFAGDGREYLYIWRFQNDGGIIYVSKNGEVTIQSGSPAVDGEYIQKAANSDAVYAKTHCYVKTADQSALSAEQEKNQNDTIITAITGYNTLIIAYDVSEKLSPYEIGIQWALSDGSLTHNILKASGAYVPHDFAIYGDCMHFKRPTGSTMTLPATANTSFLGDVYAWAGDGAVQLGCAMQKNIAREINALQYWEKSSIYFAKPFSA